MKIHRIMDLRADLKKNPSTFWINFIQIYPKWYLLILTDT